ncbi:Gfo/Idh/MocA family oxidoreductase [uncultured Sphaerochaeta sp.]|uniref:Gfo/Idh/MocA family oxidoreductase n=1 Tax=uncultured Sphaerochaeta sp. TaxID=886478 RepID=UPI002A0A47C0|nr:Gfo/Idh/MocA family oxidoreductase [uncultured Sphaerochaeta sp.]
MSKNIKVGVIGTGSMGANHVITLSRSCPEVSVSALADMDGNRMEALAKEISSPHCFNDPFLLIEEVDAVVVASPDSTHAEYVLEALKLHKPVFCEKPLAGSIEEIHKILSQEQAIGKKLVSVGFNRRFDPHHTAVKQSVDERNLGSPLLWKGEHRNAKAMYNNTGAFILNNSAGHDVDSARWILDSEPREVYCYGIRSRESLGSDACDLLLMNLLMDSGSRALAEVYVNAAYGYEVTLQVVCQDGVVQSNPAQLTSLRHENYRKSYVSDDFRAYFAQSYALELQEWAASLAEGRPFRGADAWDGYMALATTEAAGKSLKEGTVCQIEAIKKPALYQGGVVC